MKPFKKIPSLFSCFFIFSYFVVAINGEESLQSLIKSISSTAANDENKKQAFITLEKKASLGEYTVNEMIKRGVLKNLFDPLRADYGDALQKELALSVLSKMAQYSQKTMESILSDGILSLFDRLIRRGTVNVQLHAISILNIFAAKQKYRAAVFTDEILEAVVFALKTGTPPTKEKTVSLVINLLYHDKIKEKLLGLGVVDHLSNIVKTGAPAAKRNAAKTFDMLNLPLPPGVEIPQQPTPTSTTTQTPKKTMQFNDNNNLHNRGGEQTRTQTTAVSPGDVHVAFENSNSNTNDIIRSWWQSSLRQTRKIAQNNYKLRSPSRFRHK